MGQEKDKVVKSNNTFSRRQLLGKAAVGAPLVLTLASKPALGAVCNISGFASVSPSGVVRHTTDSCGGYSHGAWKNPDQGNGNSNGDGNRADWYTAGIAPNPRVGTGNMSSEAPPGVTITADPSDSALDPPATLFSDVFTHDTTSRTFEDVINQNGSFDQFAAETYLNALFFGWGMDASKISPIDVIGLHHAGVEGLTTYVNSNGTSVNLVNIDIKAFFENTQH